MQTIIDPDFSKWLLDIGDGMILLPPTPKIQFSFEVPISLISNDIVSDVFGNNFTCIDIEKFFKTFNSLPKKLRSSINQ